MRERPSDILATCDWSDSIGILDSWVLMALDIRRQSTKSTLVFPACLATETSTNSTWKYFRWILRKMKATTIFTFRRNEEVIVQHDGENCQQSTTLVSLPLWIGLLLLEMLKTVSEGSTTTIEWISSMDSHHLICDDDSSCQAWRLAENTWLTNGMMNLIPHMVSALTEIAIAHEASN